MELHALISAVLTYLTPSEQAVYLRLWHLSRHTLTFRAKSDGLAHEEDQALTAAIYMFLCNCSALWKRRQRVASKNTAQSRQNIAALFFES